MKNVKLITILALLITISSCSSVEQPSQYLVKFTVTDKERVLGNPSISVEPGKTASMATSGDDGYELSINVSPTQPNEALVNAFLKTSSGEIEPSLLVKPGEAAGAGNNNMRLTILVSEIRN